MRRVKGWFLAEAQGRGERQKKVMDADLHYQLRKSLI